MLCGTSSSAVDFDKSERVDFAVFKNEKRTFGAALANLRSRLRRVSGWLPNGNAKKATCFCSSEPLVADMVVKIFCTYLELESEKQKKISWPAFWRSKNQYLIYGREG